MGAAFTPEQEARIAEIVAVMVLRAFRVWQDERRSEMGGALQQALDGLAGDSGDA